MDGMLRESFKLQMMESSIFVTELSGLRSLEIDWLMAVG
jgi:hypothetical protein